MAEELLSVSTQRDGCRSLVVAVGELDESTSGLLVEAAKQQLDEGQDVVIEMTGVSFMSSAGVAALVQLHTHAETVDRAFRITEPSPIVRRVIEIVRLDEILLQEP